MARLEGLEFLRANEIEGKACDLKTPFAFISYAHDEQDTQIVRNVFNGLSAKGYNLWIDTANIPKNEDSWKKAAQEALMNDDDTCKLALFFRSEQSLIRQPICDELKIIRKLDHIKSIVTIDIWHDEKINANDYCDSLIKNKMKTELNICEKIFEYVDPDNSAFRMQDVNGNLEELITKLESELKKYGVYPKLEDSSVTPTQPQPIPQPITAEQPNPASVPQPMPVPTPISVQSTSCSIRVFAAAYKKFNNQYKELQKKDFMLPISPEVRDITVSLGMDVLGNKIVKADKWKPLFNDIMNCIYEASGEAYFHDISSRLETQGNSLPLVVHEAFYNQNINPDAKKLYQQVGDKPYYFYNSYGISELVKAICKQISFYVNYLTMQRKATEEDIDNITIQCEFFNPEVSNLMQTILGAAPSPKKLPAGETTMTVSVPSLPLTEGEAFVYKLYQTEYTANTLRELINQVFDKLAEVHADKIPAMADYGRITCVARKDDVDNQRIPSSKLNYFQQKQEHTVQNQIYYVSARYNREQLLGQVAHMVAFCQEPADVFQIIKEPDKKKKGRQYFGESRFE